MSEIFDLTIKTAEELVTHPLSSLKTAGKFYAKKAEELKEEIKSASTTLNHVAASLGIKAKKTSLEAMELLLGGRSAYAATIPSAGVTDASGKIYVPVTEGGNKIKIYNADGTYTGTEITLTGAPYGMAIDGNYLYISTINDTDYNESTIRIIDINNPTGAQTVMQFSDVDPANPRGMAIWNNRLYVADATLGVVHMFDINTKQEIGNIDIDTTGADLFDVVIKDGTLYVSQWKQSGTVFVQSLDANGNPTGALSNLGTFVYPTYLKLTYDRNWLAVKVRETSGSYNDVAMVNLNTSVPQYISTGITGDAFENAYEGLVASPDSNTVYFTHYDPSRSLTYVYASKLNGTWGAPVEVENIGTNLSDSIVVSKDASVAPGTLGAPSSPTMSTGGIITWQAAPPYSGSRKIYPAYSNTGTVYSPITFPEAGIPAQYVVYRGELNSLGQPITGTAGQFVTTYATTITDTTGIGITTTNYYYNIVAADKGVTTYSNPTVNVGEMDYNLPDSTPADVCLYLESTSTYTGNPVFAQGLTTSGARDLWNYIGFGSGEGLIEWWYGFVWHQYYIIDGFEGENFSIALNGCYRITSLGNRMLSYFGKVQ